METEWSEVTFSTGQVFLFVDSFTEAHVFERINVDHFPELM